MPAGAVHPALMGLDAGAAFGAPARLPTLADWNARAKAAGLALPDGRPLSFVAAAGLRGGALGYERRIAADAVIAMRDGNRHDACNALMWLAFPQTKAALNAIHVTAPRVATPNARDRRRDAATLLDESGLLVACADETLVALWRERRWREAFSERRMAGGNGVVATVIGHGLVAKLEAPFRALTGHALRLPLAPSTLPADAGAQRAALDTAAATRLAAIGNDFSPSVLLPLPLAALPCWDVEQRGAARFDDAAVFRPLRPH